MSSGSSPSSSSSGEDGQQEMLQGFKPMVEFSPPKHPDVPSEFQGVVLREEFVNACMREQTFSLAGQRYTLAGMAVGLVLTLLSPKHWTSFQRFLPFGGMGISGTFADYFMVKTYCNGLPSPPHVMERSHPLYNKFAALNKQPLFSYSSSPPPSSSSSSSS